jgi:benzoyl-CoA 2,3-dioxygenase component A
LAEVAIQTSGAPEVHRQHLIDPETCIRCNTCEETCPVDAITHDARNYVVDPAKCASCLACIAPCPTGAIDNWRSLPAEAYGVDEQLGWDALPGEKSLGPPITAPAPVTPVPVSSGTVPQTSAVVSGSSAAPGSPVAPWSAAHPNLNLYTQRAPAIATVVGNNRVTETGSESDTHHLVLDFAGTALPVLEGQSLGILPPGTDDLGRPHHARQYSIASPRDGERPGYNNVSLTVKRVIVDHQGRPVRGVCSNYLCDLQRGEAVRVIGPFGQTFLMPNHAPSHILMICTGTGSAPMRAMTERRRRIQGQGSDQGGKLMLFFGARTQEELPYFGPLMSLPRDFIDINLAFSRTPGQPRRYVQDLMRERASAVAELLRDDNTYIYVCGLRGMETGVLEALDAVATTRGLAWGALRDRLRADGRLHFETY